MDATASPEPPLKIVSPDTALGERVLILEDHTRTREALRTLLERKAYRVSAASTVAEALEVLRAPDGPALAVLDWMLPDGTGLDVVREIRAEPLGHYVYCLVVTARDGEEDVALALASGADDFLRKPCGPVELIARVKNGARTVALERQLARRIEELEVAAENMRQLGRLLPICMLCKKVRNDADYWQEIETFIHERTGADFSHGLCPACFATIGARSEKI